jgi:hypothetical protein
LKEPITLPPLTFLPFKDWRGYVTVELADLAASLETMLRSYVDERGNPMTNCVAVTHADRRPVWDLQDGDHETISRYSQIFIPRGHRQERLQHEHWLLPLYS